tara:strand:- start:2087 stop:2524 length:438 start_codon:yes stop_codon:yes gene_type:complete
MINLIIEIFDATLCALLGLPMPFGILTTTILIFIIVFAIIMLILLFKGNGDQINLPWFISGPTKVLKPIINIIGSFFGSTFRVITGKKSKFVSVPLEYKKQLHNDGGIGWVPYYGKPGRSCEENKDCPTFQKCDEDKCVIPPRSR